MEVIVGGRRSGKTYQAMQWLKEDARHVLVVSDAAERARIFRQMPALSIRPDQIVTPLAMNSQLFGRQSPVLGIDNIDTVLRTLIGRQVSLITVTGTITRLLTSRESDDYDQGTFF